MARVPAKQSGLALVLVMVLVAAATVLGLAALARSSLKLTCSDNLLQAERARYLAESGLQHGLYVLKACSVVPTTAQGPYTVDAGPDSYRFVIEPLATQGSFAVSSVGQVGPIRQSCQLSVSAKSHYYSLLRSMGPRHYWRLGETSGGYAYDIVGGWTGYYRDDVELGTESAILRDGDPSASFDGQDDSVDLRDVDLAGTQTTILCWIWPQSYANLASHNGRILAKTESLLKDEHYWMLATSLVGSQTRLRFRLRTNGAVHDLLAWAGDVSEQEWTFVAAVYDGNEMRLYQDGVLVGSRAKSGTINENDRIESWIGGSPSGTRDRPWWGRIDEVALFDHALTETQIRALYEARYPEMALLNWSE